VIDESDLQSEKHFDPRISTLFGISIVDAFWKFWINLWSRISRRNPFSTTKISFPDSIEVDDKVTPTNAEPSMNRTFRRITIDWSDEDENVDVNANDSIRVNCEFDLNVINESDLQYEKQFDPRISTLLGTKIDWSDDDENADVNANDSVRVNCAFDSIVIDESDL
jgi:hypothetical protein